MLSTLHPMASSAGPLVPMGGSLSGKGSSMVGLERLPKQQPSPAACRYLESKTTGGWIQGSIEGLQKRADPKRAPHRDNLQPANDPGRQSWSDSVFLAAKTRAKMPKIKNSDFLLGILVAATT